MNTTEKLLQELNEKRGLSYPQVGYSYFADVKGNGSSSKAVYTIVNENGGVSRSHLNGSPRVRCNKIRAEIAATGTTVETVKDYGITIAGTRWTADIAELTGQPGRIVTGYWHAGSYHFNGMNYSSKASLRNCLLYTSPSPRDQRGSRMPSSA